MVDIILPEAPMWTAMVDYSIRILTLSVVLSVLVAAMLFFGLQRMIVRPLRRITQELAAFRSRPEDAPPTARPKRGRTRSAWSSRSWRPMRQRPAPGAGREDAASRRWAPR